MIDSLADLLARGLTRYEAHALRYGMAHRKQLTIKAKCKRGDYLPQNMPQVQKLMADLTKIKRLSMDGMRRQTKP